MATIRYSTRDYHSQRDLIEQAIDPDATLRDAVQSGQITYANVMQEAADYILHIAAEYPDWVSVNEDEDAEANADSAMSAADLKCYLLELLDEQQGA